MLLYDWDKNRLIVTNEGSKVKIDLQLRGDVTIICGDSATGKTLLTDLIVKHQAEDYKNSKQNRQILVYNVYSNDLDGIFTAKHKLIIIDNASLILTKEIKEHISIDVDNRYLLFGRGITGVSASPNHYGTFQLSLESGVKVIRAHYDFNVAGWC